MGFTDRKPFTVTNEHLAARWGGALPPRAARFYLRCALCGHTFAAGDVARWIYTNSDSDDRIAGNPFVCAECDGAEEEVIAKLRSMAAEFRDIEQRFWWFVRMSRGAQ